jgi:hypothetical protein
MAFITLGSSSELQIVVPTVGSTNWGDTMRTDTFLKIAQHQHTGAADGAQLGTGSIATDAITGAKIRLDNDEYLKARNAADSANISILKVDTNDELYLSPLISNIRLKNDTYLVARDNADSADVNLLKLTTGDALDIAPLISTLRLANDTNLVARDNADSADVDLIKLNTSDKLEVGPEIATVLKLSNNLGLQHRNAADSAYVDTIKLNASDKIELGATVVAATIETVTTSVINRADSVTLTDNTGSATSAGLPTISAGESATVEYKLVRNSLIQTGTLRYDVDSSADVIDVWQGNDNGVTFTLNSGDLEYTTTSTGNDVTMEYIIIKG